MAVPDRLIDLPERIVTRLVLEFILRCATAGGVLVGDPARWRVLLAIAVASGDAARPISMNALATSLRVPYETVRRHVAALMRAGFCRREADGVLVGPETRALAAFRQFEDAIWDAFLRMVADLWTLGFDFEAPSPVAEAAPPTQARIAREALGGDGRETAQPIVQTFALRVMEAGLEPQRQDAVRALTFTAIMSGNTQHITYDPDRAWRYSRHETPPPDVERLPVSVRSVAAALRLPAETVRRRVATLIAEGVCRRVGDGVIITTEAAQDPAILRSGVLINIAFHRMIADLKRIDFAFTT